MPTGIHGIPRRRLIGPAAVICLLLAVCGCNRDQAQEPTTEARPEATRTITFYENRSITVPATIERVASGWNAQNAIIAMLGYGGCIVATTDIIKNNPTFRKMVPSIQNAVLCFRGSDANMEELLKVRPDVLFLPEGTNADRFASLNEFGISVVTLRGNALRAIVERTVITGEILGDEAYRKALRYQAYFKDKVALVTARVAKIPHAKRLKVYHAGGSMLNTSGRPSLNQDWMDVAGAVNVAENWFDGPARRTSAVSLEQIVGADPDVIVTMRPETAEEIRQDPRWATVSAVRKGRIYVNPKGMFWWCRETSEEALQFLWLAKTLYPQHFEDIDIKRETRDFYRDFFGYDLTDADIEAFLHPEARSKKNR
jgi:iron complex transport system substrate-binding protein